jgi:hypothetical protein
MRESVLSARHDRQGQATDKKMDDKKINEGEPNARILYSCRASSSSSSSFRQYSFLFRLGSGRKTSQKSAQSGDKSSHSKWEPFPAAKRPIVGHRMTNLEERKMGEKKMGTLFRIRVIRDIRGCSPFSFLPGTPAASNRIAPWQAQPFKTSRPSQPSPPQPVGNSKQ